VTEAGAVPGGSLVRRVAYNTGVQAAGKAVILLIGAASIVVATRYLGAEGYGKFALALTFVQMLGVLADAGLLTVVVREISREPGRSAELVGNALALRLLLSLAVVALAAGLALVLPYAPDVRVAIAIAGAPFVLGLVNTSLVAVFQARLMMDRAVVADVAGRAAAFGALVAVVSLDLGFYAVVASTAVGAAVTLGVTATFALRYVPLRPAADRRVWRELIWAALPLGLTLAVNELYFRADTFILSVFRDFEEVGLYAASYRIFELIAMFPALVMTSVFPLLSRYLAESRGVALRTIEVTADLFVAVGLPLAAGGLVLAPELVTLVGGDGFADAATPLRLLLFAAVLAFVNGLFGYALIAAERQRSVLWLSATALAFNVALNLALVPPFGVDAAAATAIASEVVILAGGWVLMRRHLSFYPRFGILWRSALAASLMAGALWLLDDASLAILLPLGVVLYALALWALGGIDRRALEALRI
jgi:O-antigen/teichoic acid export membrane protein